MLSKRKTEEIDINHVKKRDYETSMFSYIEEERQKFLLNRESPDNIENFIYKNLKFANHPHFAFVEHGSLKYIDFGTYNTRIMNVFQSPAKNIFELRFRVSINIQHMQIKGYEELVSRQNSALDLNHMRNTQVSSTTSYPSDIENPSWNLRLAARQLHVDHDTTVFQNCSIGPDPMWGAHLIESSVLTVCADTLMAKLIAILRDWNLDLYQQCMVEYDILKKKYPKFWTKMLLNVLPPTMLEHCRKSDVMADFFHCMCKDSKTISVLVKINSSYLQFFLMNMVAVNRVECSVILENDRWNSAKKELLERAFIAGQVANLQLLLQYFRPNYLWSSQDTEFLKVPSSNRMSRGENDDTAVVYYDNFTLLNLIRVAIYVSVSQQPDSMLADCIRLYWRASETPYLSMELINEAFKPFDDILLISHLKFTLAVNASKDLLLRVYPKDCIAEYQPRSLMHLSRCKIRQSMVSALHINFVSLPSKLKEYINLEW